jgi:hypothetical protein
LRSSRSSPRAASTPVVIRPIGQGVSLIASETNACSTI